MSITMNQGHVVLQILRTLQRCSGYMLSEDRLLDETRLALGRLIRSEFDEALREAESAGMVTGVRSPLHGVRWSITDKGRATLNE